MSAKIARQFVDIALKDYVPEDAEKVVEKLIAKFSAEVRENAKQELAYRKIRKA